MNFSRRPGARFNRGRIPTNTLGAASPPPSTPLTILGSLAWWVRADLGVTVATGVSQWDDQSGNARHFTQATGAAQPALIANAINGQAAVRSDGVNHFLGATWARSPPSVQPFYLWLIIKQITWTLSDGYCGDFNGAVGGIIYRASGVTPQISMHNGAGDLNANGAGTLGSYFRHEVQYTNSVADYVKIGATSVTGANSGDNPGSGVVQLFASGGGAVSSANGEIAEAFAFLGTPSGAQRTQLDAYCTGRYGAGLV